MDYRIKKASILGLMITAFTVFFSLSPAHGAPKDDMLKTVDELLVANSLSLQVIEKTIKNNMGTNDPRQGNLSASVAQSLKEEYVLRQEFLNRLKFQIVNYYRSTSTEQQFLDFALGKIQKQEELEGRSSKGLHKFANTLKEIFKKNLEKTQNPFEVIQYYFSQSKVTNPLSADEFLSKQDYVGRSLMLSAKKSPSFDDLVKEAVEEAEQEVQKTEAIPANSEIKNP
jgi:hypothetical protein